MQTEIDHPYRSPRAVIDVPRPSAPPRALRWALASLGAVLAGFMLAVAGLVPLLAVTGGLGLVAGLVAVAKGMANGWALLRMPRSARPAGLRGAVGAVMLGGMGSLLGAISVVLSTVHYSRGRQLRRFGRLRHAPLEADSAWHQEQYSPLVQEPREDVAAAWRENGLTEHASVAAFARLSTELLALGAPRGLVEAAHKDALDEIRHTDLCFGLAEALDGQPLGPGELDAGLSVSALLPREVRLARLAVDALVDGALNEGVSARVIAELTGVAEDERVKSILHAIAKDEARHAAHGFEIVRWCIMEGGRMVRAAVRSAAASLPEAPGRGLAERVRRSGPAPAACMAAHRMCAASLNLAAADGSLECWGIPGRERERAAFAVVRARVVARVGRLIA